MSCLQACDRCGAARLLLTHVDAGWLCARCWRAMGEPSQGRAPETAEHLRTIHDAMSARGGNQRYVVRAGKA